MSEAKVTRVQAGRGGLRTPPSWYEGDEPYEAPLRGLPAFVSLSWIDRWGSIPQANMRALHDQVRRRPADYPWWPMTRPGTGEVAYLLASALRVPGRFAALTRDYALSQRAGQKRASFFRAVLDLPAEERGAEALFVALCEDPPAAAETIAKALAGRLSEDALTPALVAWVGQAMPEHLPAFRDAGLADAGEPAGTSPGADAGRPDAADAAPAEILAEVPAAVPADARPDAVAPAAEAPPSGGEGPTGTAEAPPAQPVALASASGEPAGDAPDADLARAGEACRAALEGVRAAVDRALAGAPAGRAATLPIFQALRPAMRAARRYDAAFAAPVPVAAALSGIEDALGRVERLREGLAPAWTVPAGPVPRDALGAIAERAGAVAEAAGRVEAAFAAVEECANRMQREKRYELGAEVARLNGVMVAEAEALAGALGEAARRVGEAQAEAAVRAAAAAARTAKASAPPRPGEGTLPAASVPAAAVAAQPMHVCSTIMRIVSDDGGFDAVVGRCLGWMREKLGSGASGAMNDDGRFDVAAPGARARGVAISGPLGRCWAGRLNEADGRDPSREWVVDVCVGRNPQGTVHFAARTSVAGARAGEVARCLPRVVREVLDGVTAVDAGTHLSDVARDLAGEAGAARFQELVFNAGRALSVLAISAENGPGGPAVEAAARALAGAAHVVTLDKVAARAMAARLGPGWSVDPGTARIFPPGSDPANAGPGEAPIGRDRIRRLEEGGRGGFARHVADRILRGTEPMFAREGIPDFEDCVGMAEGAVRAAADAVDEAAGLIPHAVVERHLQEVERLRNERDMANRLIESCDEDVRRVEDENIEAWARNAALAAEIDRLRHALEAAKVPSARPAPRTVDEVCDFAATGLGAGVVVLPKAIRETRGTRNLNVARLYEGLVFLRDRYVPMRRGELDHAAYRQALHLSPFEETPCFTERGASQSFLGYLATWKGRRVELDRHLKWGVGSTDTMIRIYFHWDEAEQVVVIGHMPSHLDNNLTN